VQATLTNYILFSRRQEFHETISIIFYNWSHKIYKI